MKRCLMGLVCLLTLTAVLCVYGTTDDEMSDGASAKQGSNAREATTDVCPSPDCDESDGAMQAQAKTMRKIGMSEKNIRQIQTLGKAQIYMDSPSVILAQADTLKLTEEQRQTLQQIDTEARQKAMAVLTANQKDKIITPTDQPVSMMQMHQKMCSKMMRHHQMKEGGKEGATMTCPMCSMSHKDHGNQNDKSVQTTQPANQHRSH